MSPQPIRLGLIGDTIKPSRAPALHREAGRLAGLDVRYDLKIPAELGMDFDAVFDACRTDGLRGINVTYPYKQTVVARVEIEDPLVRRLDAVNTVVFEGGRALGHNTDHTGFIAAYRSAFGARAPGRTTIIGAGGAGSAIAFGLLALGARDLTLVDRDIGKAQHLADALRAAGLPAVSVAAVVDATVRDADGVVNCTPIGMTGHPGLPLDAGLLGSQRWGFDAVYTPRDTGFMKAGAAAGLAMLGGYELFIHQGIDAFRLFTGRSVAEAALRAALGEG